MRGELTTIDINALHCEHEQQRAPLRSPTTRVARLAHVLFEKQVVFDGELFGLRAEIFVSSAPSLFTTRLAPAR